MLQLSLLFRHSLWLSSSPTQWYSQKISTGMPPPLINIIFEESMQSNHLYPSKSLALGVVEGVPFGPRWLWRCGCSLSARYLLRLLDISTCTNWVVDNHKMCVLDNSNDVYGLCVSVLVLPVASSASGQIPMPLSEWMCKRVCAC